MPRALKTCSCLRCPAHEGYGCPTLVPHGQSRCEACTTTATRARGTSRQRGYDGAHERRFRKPVLRRDPLCTCETAGHGHTGQCLAPSTVADHYPRSRRDLVAAGMDPNDPTHGRGLCKSCHDRETSKYQPGGWHARQ